ncbi:SusD/RagB family nutrient-binding outer membrane lipoprotein [Arcticibacterium luteifluviistationis]|uniref:SusD/RagB family nutrient-binding outer membrane lipoprotein n=1 Tax=Arcticibacterium luteifluviistationis TaxID=1784714 RepID=A0A2Z4GDN4_9BACT|nr:SusD/RagB family nutrient-binding outer membrane lipoprotein [Arcticibacterium luteifluviistationis]AWV99023.1 SusD/RagB family nutrient-binding outer membrane lipoprotein [Arcticibacterium luteifluviistationis]
MKIYKKILGVTLLSCFALSSCDEDKLIELNSNKNASTDIDMSYLLAYGQLRVAGSRFESWRTNLIYSSTMIQHNATLQGYWSGDKYYYNASYSGAYWSTHFSDAIKLLTEVVDKTADDADLANIHSAAQIMRAFDLHRMTDIYGDIPYKQAGRGTIDGDANWFPAYETQEEVYSLLVADIKAARDSFSDSAKNLGEQDVLFQGDLTKWKKFANALLMRVALRMSNVDAATAQAVFTEAATSGAIDSNDADGFLTQVLGTGGDTNYNGTSLAMSSEGGGGGDNNAKVSKTFLDWMNANNDPRKMIIVGGVGNPYNDKSTWITDPELQVGLPNGYTTTTIKNIVPDFVTVDDYSFINPDIINLDDPTPFISYAEVEFMLAEAAVKGWITTDSETHFSNGINAAMNSWAAFGVQTPAQADINAYIEGLGYASADNKLELIGEQYWAATYLNHIESWSNWRRTGYPALTPTSDPNNMTGGTIPRRLRYYENEIGTNPENYKTAIARQGADLMTTRIWWDK